MWIPKHLVNNTFKQKVFRVSLNTDSKKSAVKLSYKIRTVLYDHEDTYKNNPDGYGLALNKMKQIGNTKWSNDMARGIHEDWERETAEDKLMIEAGLGFVHKIDVLGLDANLIIPHEKQRYCYDLARKKLESNPDLLPKPLQTSTPKADVVDVIDVISIEDAVTSALEKHDAVPDDVNVSLEVIYEVWKKKLPSNTKTPSYIRDVKLFIRFVGETTKIRDVSIENILAYKEFRVFIPTHTIFDDYTISKLKSMGCPDDKRPVVTTVNPIFKTVSTFLKKCRTGALGKKYIEDSSLEELLVNKDYIAEYDVPNGNKREPFSDDDLKKIFQSKLFMSDGHDFGNYKQNTGDFITSAFYWVQLLALFTGGRQGELCQLKKEDVYQYEGTKIWILDLKENLKTDGSIRKIPIHKQILDLGFLKYVESVNEERIFPDEVQKFNQETGISEGFTSFSSRWSTYRDGLGIVSSYKKHEKVFHCFRNTVETRLSELGKDGKPTETFDTGTIDSIVGHASEKRSTGEKIYNSAEYIKVKSKALNRLQYDFIDFEKMVRWDSCTFARKSFIKKK